GMVETALAMIGDKGLVTLDEERKASMVSNLLVVLCSDRDAQPVVNTGTLYQ
ncbi:MAG: SPFH domain-containing protein, partial [Gemmatimonadaceae bacterium]